MKRNISLLMFSVVMMLGIGVSANAQNLSFEFGIGIFAGIWSHGPVGDADVIDSQSITPNVMPSDGNLMAFLVSSGDFIDGTPYLGIGNLATDQLINTGIAETNSTIVTTSNQFPESPTRISYDISFLAPADNTCDNYAAMLLIEHEGSSVFSIEDANCYNSTGNGFINTNNGPVPCTQVSDDDTPYNVDDYDFVGGRSDFLNDSVSMPAAIDSHYSLNLVTGQINDGVCNQVESEVDLSADTGALFDNFQFLSLDALDPSQAGVQNTFSGDGFTPNGDVTFIYSFNVNTPADVSTRVAPDDICLGLDTPLINPRRLRTVQADGNGDASFNFNIPVSVAGATVHIQAVDITNCTGSNVNEETIDGPTQGQPPVLLALNPGTAGQVNTLSATDATPNGDVRFIYGFNQDSVTANNICPGFQSGIINPKTLPIVQSNGAGNANLNVNVPANLAGVNVLLQAADITSCTGSNVNQET
ncbi:MAG: hypothetical protein WBB48_13075, partial [Thermodesulfobacteriota bacterium]